MKKNLFPMASLAVIILFSLFIFTWCVGCDDDDDAEPTPTSTGTATKTPTPTNTHTPTATATPTPTPFPVNISVNYMVMSQGTEIGLFPKANLGAVTVPRIAGRECVVRAFVDLNGYDQNVSNVTARLYGFEDGDPLSGSPLEVTLASARPAPADDNWNHTLNFELPMDWIQEDTSFYLELDPHNTLTEINETDNRVPEAGVILFEFENTQDLDVMYVPIIHADLPPDTGAYEKIDEWLRWLYPNPAVRRSLHSTVTYTGAKVTEDGDNWNKVLNFLVSIRNAEDPPFSQYYYGIFDPGYNYGVVGLGYVGWPAAIGTDFKQFAGDTAAHEIGHNHGQWHAPCGVNSGLDDDYPYPGGEIGVVGWQIGTTTLYDKSIYKDIMSYCNKLWISDYNFAAFYEYDADLYYTTSLDVTVAERVFYLSGLLRGDQVYDLRGFDLLLHPPTPDQGRYVLVLVNAVGDEVARHRFEPIPIADLPDEFGFHVKIDRQGLECHGYRILDPTGKTISHQSRTGIPPSLVVETVDTIQGGGKRIEWVEKAETDLLRIVKVRSELKPDWEVRSMGENNTFFEVEALECAAGEVQIRIIISDGVRSAIVDYSI
ncbi:hypothetical protein ACFL27_02680 [candidate division CSSED10-310 bacterium]|uniref:Peptidase M60 domain-containing protein n=1 Tax=candidate division CSSED10-310 bacterium TaxID=2855610 RepID=A0ABV6YSK2_UNCC1